MFIAILQGKNEVPMVYFCMYLCRYLVFLGDDVNYVTGISVKFYSSWSW